ncbi:hypothetical protein GCM10007425_05280 [Lysinibacillus alkalisoli]|uniref:Uncharacterized protein n=1 Tax=Lysinibacillus alkalisoli TaxID=1911548 RepID=A0A917FY80_9BACI|nr:hypothetical protein [Lysinibacillus alkalisoli]GGG13913.1 hypothetical protein GCM10007425_05280 [Lysinibacillus alkalisoli]
MKENKTLFVLVILVVTIVLVAVLWAIMWKVSDGIFGTILPLLHQ